MRDFDRLRWEMSLLHIFLFMRGTLTFYIKGIISCFLIFLASQLVCRMFIQFYSMQKKMNANSVEDEASSLVD